MQTRFTLCFVFLLTLSSISDGTAQSLDGPQELYLEAHINDAPTDLIGRFVVLPDGSVLANAGELRNIGIETEGLLADENGDIAVDQLPGISFHIDHATQAIYFEARAEARAARVFNVDAPESFLPEALPEEPGLKDPIDRGYGVVLNYNIQTQTGLSKDDQGSIAATFGSRLFSPIGALNYGFAYSDTQGYRRYETFWRTPLADKAVQVQLGDMITRGPVWARPVRLAGLQLERNYALRPDVVRIPLPSYAGTAAVPTTVDVFDGSIRRYSTDVPAGPFELTNLPFSTGVNEATVILRDASGQELITDLTFLVSADLLSQGTADYSFSLGYPRLGIGTIDDRYLADLFGVASLRFGLTDSVTLSAHTEGGDGLIVGGIGATFRVGKLGTVSLSHARSSSEGGTGALTDISIRAQQGMLSFSGRLLRTEETFYDVARYTALTGNTLEDDLLGFSTASRLNQISIGYNPPGRWSGIQAVYAATDRIDGTNTQSLGLSSTFEFGKSSSLSVSALASVGDVSDMMIGASVYVPLGDRRSARGRLQTGNGQTVYAAGLSQSRDANLRKWDWRLDAIRDARASVNAFAGRDFAMGRIELAARAYDRGANVGLRAEGSVVVAGGGFFLSKRIDDAFAIVHVGAPDVEVEVENRPAGRTGRSGKMIVPDLRSYESTAIKINVDNLPVEADVNSVSEKIVPAYNTGVTVDFDVDTNPSNALIYLKLPSGEPVEVGLNAVLDGRSETYIVGYDGMVFLNDLAANNTVRVTQTDGWNCSAQFAYAPQPGTVTDLGEVLCQ